MGSEEIQERYINPYTDFGFKKLFGTELNKELLISFLNALLQGEQTVKMERPIALQERVFNRLFEAAEIARFNRRELVEYEDSLKAFRDWYSVIKTTLNKGRAEGRAEEKAAIARQMKANNLPTEVIAKYTGLSPEEISKLEP